MARGSGIIGLAGIRPVCKIPQIKPKLPLVRPLLNYPKVIPVAHKFHMYMTICMCVGGSKRFVHAEPIGLGGRP